MSSERAAVLVLGILRAAQRNDATTFSHFTSNTQNNVDVSVDNCRGYSPLEGFD